MFTRIRWTAITLATLAGGAWILMVEPAVAQFGGGTTSTGSFGTRTLGGSASSNRTGQSSGVGGTGSQTGQGTGTGTGTGAGAGGSGGSTTLSGSERFLKANRGAGSFVGADSGDAVNPLSTGGAAGQGAMGGAMGNQMMMQAFRQSQQQGQNQQQNQGKNAKTQLRAAFKVGFETQPVVSTAFTTRLQTRFDNLPALKDKGSITTSMEGDVLVLRGQVASAADRKLAEDLLSLEPAVSQVRNELVIVQSASVNPATTNPAKPASAGALAPASVSRPVER